MPGSSGVVVDASALAAVVFNEPAADEVVEQIGGDRLVAPSLLTYELANVYVVKVRRYPDQEQALDRAFSMLGSFDIELLLGKMV